MSLFLIIPGLTLPTITGWAILRLLEGRCPVLSTLERWILGCVGGITCTMFAIFLLHIIGLIRFTFWGFLSVQIILTSLLIATYVARKLPTTHYSLQTTDISSWSPLTKLLVITLTLWTIIKIAGGVIMLTQTPAYHDDVFNNWNMRGKVFFETHRLTLTLPLGNEVFSNDGVSSYPPTVPMVKTWLALLNGEWHEGLVNSMHLVWYLAVLLVLFLFLRRVIGTLWALLGTYLLSSLPLYLIHGMNAYADVFLSLHIFIPLLLAFLGISHADPRSRLSFLRLSAFFASLLVFTKNEALLMYLPSLLLSIGFLILYQVHQKCFTKREAFAILFMFLGFLTITTIPWLIFKYIHHLPFGNAKAVLGLSIGWQPNVLYALWINTFFEGNWIFLWPVFLGILLLKWHDAFLSPLVLIITFILIVLSGQTLLYLFTSLSEEALRQTGLARGLVHLAPLTVFVTTILLHNTWTRKNHEEL